MMRGHRWIRVAAPAQPQIASAFLVQGRASHYPRAHGGVRPAAWEIREIDSLRNAWAMHPHPGGALESWITA
jgi:hypothetical protein